MILFQLRLAASWRSRLDSNLQPSESNSDALSIEPRDLGDALLAAAKGLSTIASNRIVRRVDDTLRRETSSMSTRFRK